MTESKLDDAALLSSSPTILLEAVRVIASGAQLEPESAYLLERCGLVTGNELTEAGSSLFKLAWVLRKTSDAERALGQALRILTPIQVIEQELSGLGPIPEDGVLELLRRHRALEPSETIDTIRPMLRWLSTIGVLAYSTKLKTVRSLAPPPDAALAGEIPGIASMISPKTPYLNIVRLRRIIRPLGGTIWWADPHFGARALEELAQELTTSRVREIRILSGDAENVVSGKSLKDFERFRAELQSKGVKSDWRVDGRATRDWHDRWVADDQVVWNVPPINTLFKNDYSEIAPASERPPFIEWWNRSLPRI